MDERMENVILLLRTSLWGDPLPEGFCADAELLRELQNHSVTSLTAIAIENIGMPPEVRKKWKQIVCSQSIFGAYCQHEQENLPITVPYTILKGTETARYYPHPELRALGDIDIMPEREGFEQACGELAAAGWELVSKGRRHWLYNRGRITLELHISDAHADDLSRAESLDELILKNIRPDHTLPDEINGLVLIEHINHHMESGLGLRQIIDWMVFADRCLPDEKWPEFQALVRRTGHEQLAIVTTRMCEQYLGLPERKWCAGADPEVTAQLMEYVMACGNFGHKIEEGHRVSSSFLASTRTLVNTIRYLQARGLVNWAAARRNRLLRPFAWIYQTGRYFFKGVNRELPLRQLRQEYEESRQRNKLFDALGVAREQNGLVAYRNGRYVKELQG